MNKKNVFLIVLFMVGNCAFSLGSLFSMSQEKAFNCYDVKLQEQASDFSVKLYCDTPLDKAVVTDDYKTRWDLDRFIECDKKYSCIHVGKPDGSSRDFTVESFITHVDAWHKTKRRALVFDDLESLINFKEEQPCFSLFKDLCLYLPNVSRFFILKYDNERIRRIVERTLQSHGISGTIICLTAYPSFSYANVEAELRKHFECFWRIRFCTFDKRERAFVDEGFIDY